MASAADLVFLVMSVSLAPLCAELMSIRSSKAPAIWIKESAPKIYRKTRSGPTPVKALGPTDQHSQVQLYREGPNDKLFIFLQVNNFDKNLKIGPAPDCAPELSFLAGKDLSALLNSEKIATEYALLQSKRPCLTVIFPEVNAYTVGQFIYLYEVTTSFAGTLFGIDPYDQPAVELGKAATFALMGKTGFEKLEQQIHP